MIKGGNPIRSGLRRLSETKQKSAGSIYVIRGAPGRDTSTQCFQRCLSSFIALIMVRFRVRIRRYCAAVQTPPARRPRAPPRDVFRSVSGTFV